MNIWVKSMQKSWESCQRRKPKMESVFQKLRKNKNDYMKIWVKSWESCVLIFSFFNEIGFQLVLVNGRTVNYDCETNPKKLGW